MFILSLFVFIVYSIKEGQLLHGIPLHYRSHGITKHPADLIHPSAPSRAASIVGKEGACQGERGRIGEEKSVVNGSLAG